ncbi:MAG: nitroreductase family protein [Actinomycetes bacterium]
MELLETIARRRMVRRTSGEPVEREVLLHLLEAARRAPSAGFSQGQRFVVVVDDERRRALAELAGEPDYVARGFDPWLSAAPALVVPCADERAYRARYDEPDKSGGPGQWDVPYWWVDAGAALENLLLAVVDAGLVAGFLGAHAVPGLAGFLGLPEGVHPLGVVPIGHPHPDGDRPSGSLARGWADLDDVVSWDAWDG